LTGPDTATRGPAGADHGPTGGPAHA
jgi:hypothetical protein